MRILKIMISGCCGRLGSAVARLAADRRGFEVVCGVDPAAGDTPFPVYSSFGEVKETCDVLIDASHHSLTPDLLAFAAERGLPTVICTTGHTDPETEMIVAYSKKIPILKSRNMSIGVNLLIELVKKAAQSLGEGFDVEIVEAHHSKKLDAPSGTALMLADAVKSVREEAEYVYDRHDVRRERGENEVGIHSIRGGTIVGEHSVIFAGRDEVITLSHSAGSRDLFAAGALKAAEFAADAAPGLYTMADVIK